MTIYLNKKLILTAFIGSNNLGDEAIFVSIISILKDFNDTELNVISINPKKTENLLRAMCLHENLKIVWTRNFIGIIKSILRSEILICGGGGLLQDKTSIYNIFYHLWKPFLAKLFGKKVILYGIGAGPIETIFGKIIVKFALQLVNLVTTRDEESKDLLMSISKSRTRIDAFTDPSVMLYLPTRQEVKKIFDAEDIPWNNSIIGVCLRHWFDTRKFIPVSIVKRFNLKNEIQNSKYNHFIKTVAFSLDYIMEKYRSRILFIPFWKGRDDIVHRDVIALMRNQDYIYELKGNYSPVEIKGLMRELRIVIGMRLHAIIFASSLSIPFVAIEYQPKVGSFVKQLFRRNNRDYQKHLKIPVDEFNKQVWKDRIDYVMNNKIKISHELSLTKDRLDLLNSQNVNRLIDFIKNS